MFSVQEVVLEVNHQDRLLHLPHREALVLHQDLVRAQHQHILRVLLHHEIPGTSADFTLMLLNTRIKCYQLLVQLDFTLAD